MTLNSDAKFNVKWTCSFKYDLRNFVKFHFYGLFLSKVYKVWAKKIQRSYITHDTKRWCKIWRTLTLRFQIWHEELGELYYSTQTLKTLHWSAILSKACNVLARKSQKKYVSWDWRLMQSLKENWLVSWKMT